MEKLEEENLNSNPVLLMPRTKKLQCLLYLSFLTLGLGTLLPWNVFITAESYWQFKFRNTTEDLMDGGGDPSQEVSLTPLQELYTPLQAVLSQLPNFSFLIINAIVGHRFCMRKRLMMTLFVMVGLFTLTTVFVRVNTDDWQLGFFVLTMVTIVFINCSGALFQGSLFGLTGMFPSNYMTAVVTGQALGGVFASTARIISLALGGEDVQSAFIYFLIAVAVMLFTLFALFYLFRTPQYKDVMEKVTEAAEEENQPLTGRQLLVLSKGVLAQIWPVGVTVTAVYAVTLSVFPAVLVQIQSVYTETEWAEKYYQPVMTFLLFNVGDLLGRQLGGIMLWPRQGSWLLYVFTATRLVFVPLFGLCNRPHSQGLLPTVFSSDVAYGILMTVFSVSNGYLGSLCMIYGPRMVSNRKDAQSAGSVMAAMVGVGLVLGSIASFVVTAIL